MKYLSLLALCLLILTISCNKDTDAQGNCPIAASPYYYSYGGATIQFPTAFTPNGDGRNDVFRPVGIAGISNFSMTVYDGAGNTMYRNNDPYGFGWTGRLSGQELAAGRYPVNFQFTALNGEVVNKNICVSLLSYGGNNCITRSNGEQYYFEDQLNLFSPGQSYYATSEVMCQ